MFDISIQSGALLAVVLYYRKDFIDIVTFRDRELLRSLTIAFLPIGFWVIIWGICAGKSFDTLFVSLAFHSGALLMLHVEFLHRREKQRINSVRNVSNNDAIKIGLVQTLALIRALVGQCCYHRRNVFWLKPFTATNFSFLLAVPVILSATIYSLYLKFEEINIENIQISLLVSLLLLHLLFWL